MRSSEEEGGEEKRKSEESLQLAKRGLRDGGAIKQRGVGMPEDERGNRHVASSGKGKEGKLKRRASKRELKSECGRDRILFEPPGLEKVVADDRRRNREKLKSDEATEGWGGKGQC